MTDKEQALVLIKELKKFQNPSEKVKELIKELEKVANG